MPVNVVNSSRLSEVRSELARERQEREKREIRAMIAEYGTDDYADGTMLMCTKESYGGIDKPITFILVKNTRSIEGGWRRTGSTHELTWDNLVDWLLIEGTPVRKADLIELAPKVTEADVKAPEIPLPEAD